MKASSNWFKASKCTKCEKKIDPYKPMWSQADVTLCLACYTSIVLNHLDLSSLRW